MKHITTASLPRGSVTSHGAAMIAAIGQAAIVAGDVAIGYSARHDARLAYIAAAAMLLLAVFFDTHR